MKLRMSTLVTIVLVTISSLAYGQNWSATTTGWFLKDVWKHQNVSWAVGEAGVIFKEDAAGWHSVNSGTYEVLNGVWGTDPSNIWAIGENGMILHYDGNYWTPISSNVQVNLYGIWGIDENNIWAVGASGVVLRYDGSSWSELPSTGTASFLYDIWGTGPNDLWAVGENGGIYRFNGTSWTPQNSGTTQFLLGIWGVDASNIWVVGQTGTILKFNGVSWQPETVDVQNFQYLYDVWGESANSIWAVGDGGTIYKYSGGPNWVLQASGTTQFLTGVHSDSGGNLNVVGKYGTILGNNGLAWEVKSPQTNVNIADCWAINDSTAAAVGDEGTFCKLTGTTWLKVTAPISENLQGVWSADASTHFSVGDNGNIWEYDGSIWTNHSVAISESLNDIWGLDYNNIWTVGDNGRMYKFDGTNWSLQSAGISANITSIYGINTTNIWVGCDNGAIYYFNGVSWQLQFSAAASVNGLWGVSPTAFYAASSSGVIYSFDGVSWSVQGAPTNAILEGVWGTSSSDMWVIGENNAIYHYDGSNWTNESSYILGLDHTSIHGAGSFAWSTSSLGSIMRLNLCDPDVQDVIGGGVYCTGSTGISVGLNDSELGTSYQLMLDGNPIGSPMMGSGGVVNFGPQTLVGDYYVIGTSGGNCSVLMNSTVTVEAVSPISISTQPMDQSIYQNQSVTFESQATNAIEGDCIWQYSTDGVQWLNLSNGGSSPTVSGADSSELELAGTPVSYNGYLFRYFCENNCGSATSDEALLDVTVGLSEVEGTIVVFPNPVINNLIIENISSEVEVTIIDVLGKNLQLQQKTIGGNRVVDFSQLSNGMYYVQLSNFRTVVPIVKCN